MTIRWFVVHAGTYRSLPVTGSLMPRKGKELRSEFSNMYFFGVFHVALRVMVQTVEKSLPCKQFTR